MIITINTIRMNISHHPSEGEQWGRYNLLRYIYIYIFSPINQGIIDSTPSIIYGLTMVYGRYNYS